MDKQNPKPASTVVLCHQKEQWPYKILLIKRHPEAKFLPNAHVFPGGQVEEQDHQEGLRYAADTANIARMSQYFVVEHDLLCAHVAAAVRETIEEAGVFLLGRKPEQEKPMCLDNIWPLSWWVTPPGETRRFDTWFFLATINDDHIGDFPSGFESSEPCWLSPSEALHSHEHHQIFLAPPTRAILERLAHSDSLDQALTMVDRPLRPIHPRFVDYKHEKVLVLPGHEQHEDPIKSSFIMKTSYLFK